MAVSNGQLANEDTFNEGFMSRTTDTSTTGKVDLEENSTTDIIDAQRVINEIADTVGTTPQAATDANAKEYANNNVIIDGENHKQGLEKLDAEFDPSTGHTHNGTDSARVDAANLSNVNNFHGQQVELDVNGASGTSQDVSALFSGKASGGDANTAGVVTSTPGNRVEVIDNQFREIEDSAGLKVYGRITESSGTWTLSFFVNSAGTETAFSLPSQNIRILFMEVFTQATRPTIPPNVNVFDSLAAVEDIPDATQTQPGIVNTSAQTFGGAKNFANRPTVASVDVVDISASQVITNKDIDGGTASNTNRITVPKGTNAALTALTRKEGTIVYDTDSDQFLGDNGTSLAQLGGGEGGGGLDIFHTDDFEDTEASDFTTGNNSTFLGTGTLNGTLSNETTDPIAGGRSILYTAGASSEDDYIASPAITLDDKQQNQDISLTFYYKSDVDAEVVIYDVTNSTVLTRVTDELTETSDIKRFSVAVRTASTTASIRYGIHFTTTPTSGDETLIDDVELSTNPFVVRNIDRENLYSARIANPSGTASITSQNSTWISSVSRTTEGKVLVTYVSGFFGGQIPTLSGNVTTSTTLFPKSLHFENPTATSVTVVTGIDNDLEDRSFTLQAQRQGSDYGQTQENVIAPFRAFKNQYTARVDNNGSTASIITRDDDSNFFTTTNRTGAGSVTVSWDGGLSVVPVVQVTGVDSAEEMRVTSVSTTSCVVQSLSGADVSIDTDFSITVIRQGADVSDSEFLAAIPKPPLSANINNNGTASIASQVGAFISSATRSSAGVVTISFNSGSFLITPAVTATVINNGNGRASIASISTASVTVNTVDESGTGALTDYNFSIVFYPQG